MASVTSLDERTTTIDYLSLLPIELWGEIFAQVQDHWAYGASNSDDPLVFFPIEYLSSTSMRQAQSIRIRRLLICKALRPIMETIVYREVLVFCKRDDKDEFVRFVSSMRLDGRGSRGTLLKQLKINGTQWEEVVSLLEVMGEWCPDIGLIDFWITGRDVQCMPVWKEVARNWKDTIRTFISSTQQGWATTLDATSQFSQLTTLELLLVNTNYSGERTEYTFPSVKRLDISGRCIYTEDLPKLNFPALQWLRLQMDAHMYSIYQQDKMASFLQLHGSTIQGIELYTWLQFTLQTFYRPLINLSRLETLILGHWFRNIDPSIVGDMNLRLKTLILRVVPLSAIENLRKPSEAVLLKISRYLERFILIVDPGAEAAGRLELERFASFLDSNVSCEIRVDPTRHQG